MYLIVNTFIILPFIQCYAENQFYHYFTFNDQLDFILGDSSLHIAMRARSKAIVGVLLKNPKHSQLLYKPNRNINNTIFWDFMSLACLRTNSTTEVSRPFTTVRYDCRRSTICKCMQFLLILYRNNIFLIIII